MQMLHMGTGEIVTNAIYCLFLILFCVNPSLKKSKNLLQFKQSLQAAVVRTPQHLKLYNMYMYMYCKVNLWFEIERSPQNNYHNAGVDRYSSYLWLALDLLSLACSMFTTDEREIIRTCIHITKVWQILNESYVVSLCTYT